MTRRISPTAAIAASLLCFAPLIARADAATDARLAKMEARINQLEDKLATSEATIQKQEEMLKAQATPAVSAGSEPSELDAFFKTVQFNGYVAASYMYQFNNPSDPIYANSANQFNIDHNTFNLDGAKIEIMRPATNPGDAGFQIDLLFGANSGVLDGIRTAPTPDNPFPSGPLFGANNGLYVQDLYVSYNWDNVLFKFGQWETLLGYEVIDSVANRNVTQGLLFTYAIPLVHTGIQASGKIGGSDSAFGWAAAYTNGWNNPVDTNDNKGVLGQLNYSSSAFSTALSGYWGADRNTGFTGQEVGSADQAVVLDWTATLTANDLLTFWANADWGIQKDVHFVTGPQTGTTKDAVWYGLALGTQFTFTEKTSLAVRGEWLRDTAGYRIVAGNNTSAYSLTGTLAYKLTPNLLTRLEARYDGLTTNGSSDNFFFPKGNTSGASSNDLQGLVQVAYIFD
jgi:Putative beta-barrel porin-2, OmpL-like. bbp2